MKKISLDGCTICGKMAVIFWVRNDEHGSRLEIAMRIVFVYIEV
jgi:hypothetical protein